MGVSLGGGDGAKTRSTGEVSMFPVLPLRGMERNGEMDVKMDV